MSLQLLSWPAALVGCGVLAAILFLIQRLRVQHREVEVQTTLFWQVAIEETRARVFVKRFRHWKPWVLLVAIASLLWLMFAGPQKTSSDGVRHVVILDWSVDDETIRAADIETAIRFAESLPADAREVVAVGTKMETLLAPNEPVNLTKLRSADVQVGQSNGLDWAIQTQADRVTDKQRIAIYLIGDGEIHEARLPTVLTASDRDGDLLSVSRIPRETAVEDAVALRTLGLSEAMSGAWDRVDLWLDFVSPSGEPLTADQIAISSNGQPISQKLVVTDGGPFELRDLPTDGAVLDVDVDGTRIGSITLPKRNKISIAFAGNVPVIVRELVELDPACEVVTGDADVVIGSTETADFRFKLPGDNAAAFAVTTDTSGDAENALNAIVDELALRQIDATSLAEQSGETIQVDVNVGEKRQVAMWSSLFGSGFDFRESRACPIVVSRTIRWLANSPPIVEWAAVGDRLPANAPQFVRASVGETMSSTGIGLKTTRLARDVEAPAQFAEAKVGGVAFSPFTLLGLLVVALLTAEWVLFQRGHMP